MAPKPFTDMTSEELTGSLGMPGSLNSQSVMAELTRRQMEAQITTARWMRWSVVALTIATVVNTLVQIGFQFSS